MIKLFAFLVLMGFRRRFFIYLKRLWWLIGGRSDGRAEGALDEVDGFLLLHWLIHPDCLENTLCGFIIFFQHTALLVFLARAAGAGVISAGFFYHIAISLIVMAILWILSIIVPVF